MRNVENPNHDPPATIDILQRVKPGFEAAFEVVLADLCEAAKTFEGHLGVNVFRPIDHANPEYRIVFKFDRISHLNFLLSLWENLTDLRYFSPRQIKVSPQFDRRGLSSGKLLPFATNY
ncbi:MAG: hypothetical protein KME05_20180 [Gloeocapsa sp. UFS-A4-WI-NPMV-4B04]|jgi:antibiotic biosynthesis monooxygenase (ABM) superfamily enzyme|nr:hypothetical protein [Gloeocapsa sp. UFS-A4-WI-NPMV-4B04]